MNSLIVNIWASAKVVPVSKSSPRGVEQFSCSADRNEVFCRKLSLFNSGFRTRRHVPVVYPWFAGPHTHLIMPAPSSPCPLPQVPSLWTLEIHLIHFWGEKYPQKSYLQPLCCCYGQDFIMTVTNIIGITLHSIQNINLVMMKAR